MCFKKGDRAGLGSRRNGFWSIRIKWMVSERAGGKWCFFVVWKLTGTGFDVGLGANVLKNRARSKNSCIHENSSYREVGCVQRFRRLETLSDSYCGKRKVRLERLRMAHPYPTPKLGISAPQAVRKMFGCGVGVPTSHGGGGSVVVVLRARAAGVPNERVLERSRKQLVKK